MERYSVMYVLLKIVEDPDWKLPIALIVDSIFSVPIIYYLCSNYIHLTIICAPVCS